MKVFVLGCNGQLGSEIMRCPSEPSLERVGADLPEIDIANQNSVRDWMDSIRPDLVVNAAAYTLVDQAEREPDKAFSANRDGPATISHVCNTFGIPLIHVSTDYVFDGKKTTPYLETDPVCPLGVYGESKAQGEFKVASILSEHIILRTSWLYGVYGNNFVKTMLKIGRERDEISVVSDQRGCPTSAADLAQAVLNITRQILQNPSVTWGIYHFCDRNATSWYGFASAIFEYANRLAGFPVPRILPIPTDAYLTAARRPKYSVLDTTRIQKHFNIVPPLWKTSLKHTLKRILK
jgi:dTDP-4-dehydrorhamnose reductase